MEYSSASRTAGVVAQEVTLGGVKYLLSQPDKVRKAADEESVVLARRLDMLPAIARACEALPPESQEAWRNAYISHLVCGFASRDEWNAYYSSLWYEAFRFWNALDPEHRVDRSHPKRPRTRTLVEGVTWAYEIIADEAVTPDERLAFRVAARIVSQSDLVKNSSGSEATSPPPMDTPSTEAGPVSTPGESSMG